MGLDRRLAHLASLVYNLAPAEGEEVIHRLKLPNSWAQVVRDAIVLRERESELAEASLTPSQTFRLLDGMCGAAIMAVSRITESSLVSHRLAQYLNEWRFVATVLDGRDLLSMGVPPGPLVGDILRQLQDAKLDRRVLNKEDECRMVQNILNPDGGQ